MKIVKTLEASYKHDSEKWKLNGPIPTEDYKFTILLDDDHLIEVGVFCVKSQGCIEYHACISTQVGCKFGCRMCSSGKNGFFRNLTSQEILDEIKLLEDYIGCTQLDQILFMGIGEPLDNYDNFIDALKKLTHYSGRLSFATVGLPDKFIKLSKEYLPKLKMVWVSLHASVDDKRSLIMPVNRSFKIAAVLNSAKEFALITTARVWINYLLFQGFNDSTEDAKSLVKLMKDSEGYFKVQISKPNNNFSGYEASTGLQLRLFENKLKSLGLKNETFCFEASGTDVDAGCGQFIYLVK